MKREAVKNIKKSVGKQLKEIRNATTGHGKSLTERLKINVKIQYVDWASVRPVTRSHMGGWLKRLQLMGCRTSWQTGSKVGLALEAHE